MIGGIDYKTFKAKYDAIKSNYPETLAWMKHKAKWEHITLMAVMNHYSKHIETLMESEERQAAECLE